MKFNSSLFFVAISLFGFCVCQIMDGAPIPVKVSRVESFKKTIEDFIKTNQADNDWIYVDSIKSATSQVVAGILYDIEFTAVRTKCHKNGPANSKDKCETKEVQNNCKVKIWEKSWLNFIGIDEIDCLGLKFKK